MYIEFALIGRNSVYLNEATEFIHAWSSRFSVQYQTKIVKYKLRLTFNEDQYYHLFSLTWEGLPYRIVTDLNNKLS